MNKVQILATGPQLVKEGTRGIEPVIEELIKQAQNEIQILAYLFTPQAVYILGLLEKAAERGLKITIVVNRLESQDEKIRKRLVSMKNRFPHLLLVDFNDSKGRQLHAKVIIADRRRAVIGSANFSWGGMVTNYEVAILVEGEAAWELAQLVDSLIRSVTNTCEREQA